jgi:hypothetical protein
MKRPNGEYELMVSYDTDDVRQESVMSERLGDIACDADVRCFCLKREAWMEWAGCHRAGAIGECLKAPHRSIVS